MTVKQFTSNMPLKVLSLLIAVVLWFVVLGSRNVEITKDIPLELVMPPDLVVANDVTDRVSFRIAGPKAFLRNILNRKELPIRVNLSNAKAGLVTYRFFSDNIQLPIGVKVLFINPASIGVKLESVKSREVPLRLITQGRAAPGVRISRLELGTNRVRIKGPESKIDAIGELSTLPLDLGGLRESGSRDSSVDFSRHAGVVLEGEAPRVSFDVVEESAQFRLRGIKVKVLSDRRTQVAPRDVAVYVSASPEELKRLGRTKLSALVDMRGRGPGTYEVPLTVELPDTVKLVKVLPQKVKVTVY